MGPGGRGAGRASLPSTSLLVELVLAPRVARLVALPSCGFRLQLKFKT